MTVLDLDDVIARMPGWSDAPLEVVPIEGGLTNSNYRVTVGTERFCVRIPGAGSSFLAIDRRAEHRNTVAAAESGVGPRVVAALGDTPVLVLEWIEGEVQSAASLQERPDAVERIADAVLRLHAGPAFVNRFDMFRTVERYRRIVEEHDMPVPEAHAGYAPLVARIEEAMARRPVELRPCNNDLLAANYIDVGGAFRIIDYEYGGQNDPFFELGNTVAESELGDDVLARLVEAYLGRPSPSGVARALLWGVVANYGWTLWACIQQAVSGIDFDFWAWGVDDKFARAVAAFEGDDLGRLLEDVARDR